MANLPDSFSERMKQQLGDEYADYLSSFRQKCYNGIRINTRKLEPEVFEKISPFGLRPIPWVKNGYYIDADKPGAHPYYYAGLYYVQEPSAMTPASLLPVVPGDRVLDLCAAPGGKSTELAARLKGKGVLVSNDISNSRAKALLKNLELFGADNILVVSEAPNKLVDYFPEYFDKILVDAPCSGEGMFRKSPAIMKNWEQYGTEYYHKLQLEILPQAIKMLKPGGYLLYSTCTFSPEENEGSIQTVLDAYPELSVVSAIETNGITSDGRDFSGFSYGHPEWVDHGNVELSKTLRLWPHRLEGEGHFIALLQKGETLSEHEKLPEDCKSNSRNHSELNNRTGKPPVLSEETEQFLATLKRSIPTERLYLQEERLFLLPELDVNTKGLRILRSGLFLGEMKKKRFEPSQALACTLKIEEYDNCYSLAADDPDVIKYLKCETIEAKHDCKDGWVLVCVDKYPLGWAKHADKSLKNRYLPGWRWM